VTTLASFGSTFGTLEIDGVHGVSVPVVCHFGAGKQKRNPLPILCFH
jgi:hypothetical protein